MMRPMSFVMWFGPAIGAASGGPCQYTESREQQAEGGSLILFVGAGPHAAVSCPTPLWPSRILLEKSFPVDGPTQAGIFLLSWPPVAWWAGSEDSWFDRRQLLDGSRCTQIPLPQPGKGKALPERTTARSEADPVFHWARPALHQADC